MKNLSVKKLALAGMFCALAVVGSVFSFPIFGSKCAPVQHMVNILCAVLLGLTTGWAWPCGLAAAQSAGAGQPDGIPRQHVWGFALRADLP